MSNTNKKEECGCKDTFESVCYHGIRPAPEKWEKEIEKEVDSLCFYFDWKRDGEEPFQIERSMVRLVTFTEQKAKEEEVLRIRNLCRKFYIDDVDWSEWGMNDTEAGEQFDTSFNQALKDLSHKIAESNE